MLCAEQNVHGRYDEEREQRADRQAREEHDSHRATPRGACAGGNDERHDTEHHRRGRHEDRSQSHCRGLLDGRDLGAPLALQLIGELHDQNAVLADETEQRDQPHLRVDIECGEHRN